ncbi:MAG: acyl-CoA thioesterase [Acidobacteria bacterium]|nr:acyl-CoA thioesterase [Acidobacteriota bacterium]
MESHHARIRVRYAETDQMGVVYHANYIVWMEVGRVEFCRASGLSYREMEQDGALHLAVIEANCRYIAPARYDDEIDIETRIEKATTRGVHFVYLMRNVMTAQKVAEGFSRHLFLDHDLKPIRLPEQFYSQFGLSSPQAL